MIDTSVNSTSPNKLSIGSRCSFFKVSIRPGECFQMCPKNFDVKFLFFRLDFIWWVAIDRFLFRRFSVTEMWILWFCSCIILKADYENCHDDLWQSEKFREDKGQFFVIPPLFFGNTYAKNVWSINFPMQCILFQRIPLFLALCHSNFVAKVTILQ